MISGVYIITNYIDSRVYIGSSVNIKERWCEHKRDLLKDNHQNTHLQNFVNKYGIDVLNFKILENCENTLEREQYYLDSIDNKFNISNSASAPMLGKKHSKEAIEKIRIRSAGKNNPMFGKKRPKELLEKLRQSNLGRKKSFNEKIIRLIKLNNRKEVIIIKNNIITICFSISHAAIILNVTMASASKALNTGGYCKNHKIYEYSGDFYNKKILMSNLDKFTEKLHPMPELIQLLKNL